MAVWINPFTGSPQESDNPPLGGGMPAIPAGTAVYQGDPSDFGSAGMNPADSNPLTIPIGPGGSSPIDVTFSGGYNFTPDRGRLFYMPGDEMRVLAGYSDIGSLQDALHAAGYLKGDYLYGSRDDKTIAAMKALLGDANATGLSWQEMLSGGMNAAAAKKGGGGGGGGGGSSVAAITDDDIRVLANQVSQEVLGRDLRSGESDAFIPAFRAALTTGTTAKTAATNLVRKEVAPQGEADAHQVGNVMSVIQKALGG